MIIVPEHQKRVALIRAMLSLEQAPWNGVISWGKISTVLGVSGEAARNQYKRLVAAVEANGYTIQEFVSQVANGQQLDTSGDGYSYDEQSDCYTTMFADGECIRVTGNNHRRMRDAYRSDDGASLSPQQICKANDFPVSYWKEYAKIHGFVRIGDGLDYQESKAIIPQLSAARRKIETDARKWQQFNAIIMQEIEKALSGLKIKSYPVTEKPSSGQMAVLSPFIDLHFGKVGVDYDMKIATARLRSATAALLGQIDPRGISRVIVPIGSDSLNIDNLFATTTAGTPQATARAIEVFKLYPTVLLETIDMIRAHFQGKQVEITANPGNHDAMATIHQSSIVAAAYRNDPTMVVHDSTERSYFVHGRNLVCVTHGDKIPDNRIAGVVAGEQASAWGRTIWRYVLRGHYHRFSVTPSNDLTVIGVPALTGRDDWHDSKGYVGQPGAIALLFGRGLEAMKFYWV